MRGRGFAQILGLVSLLTGSTLLGTQAAAQGATDHWLGWYAGGTFGISWTDVDIAIPPDSFSLNYDGFTGGIIAGNNGIGDPVTCLEVIPVDNDNVMSQPFGFRIVLSYFELGADSSRYVSNHFEPL